jgi:transposase
VPTDQEEAVRDLLRCREDIRADLLRARHRISKFPLRHGRRYTATKSTWSQRHRAWLRAQTWPLPALAHTHEAYLRAVDEAVARLRAVEVQRKSSSRWSGSTRVSRASAGSVAWTTSPR